MNEDVIGRGMIELPEAPPPTPEEIAFLAGPNCGQCNHWRQTPRPRAVVDEAAIAHLPKAQREKVREQARLHNAGALMGEERMGECRRVLLTVPNVRPTPQGQLQFGGSISYYPDGIPAAFRCCGQFSPKEETPDGRAAVE